MTVLAKTTNGSVLTFTLNEFPNLSPGLQAPVGSEARVMKNNSGSTWSKYGPLDTDWKNLDDSDVKDSILFYEDWFSSGIAGKSGLVLTNGASGTANTTSQASTGNIMGVLTISSAGLLNSYSFVNSATSAGSYLTVQNKEIVFETLVNIPVLFQDKAFFVGLGKNNNTTEHTYGLYFKFRGSESANWQCKSANNSTRTTSVSSIPVVAGQWVTLKIIFKNGVATYFVDNVLAGTISTNIPTQPVFVSMGMTTNALLDLNVRSVHIDYFSLKINLDTPRI